MTEHEYHLIGVPFTEQPPIFELRLEDHLPDIDPDSYNINDKELPKLDPKEYFVTSGEAVAKAKKLSSDLWKLAGEIRQYIADKKHPKKYKAYEEAVWKAAGRSRTLINNLITARGPACFLETEWRNHVLLAIPKNPRNKTE